MRDQEISEFTAFHQQMAAVTRETSNVKLLHSHNFVSEIQIFENKEANNKRLANSAQPIRNSPDVRCENKKSAF